MNIAEILKKCPKGTKLYSPIFGEVILDCVKDGVEYPIRCSALDSVYPFFMSDGRYLDYTDAECALFPAKDQRDWSKFEIPNQSKPEPQFKPFDKVLVRDRDTDEWKCNLFSHINIDGYYVCAGTWWKQCIPYNGNEHLLGTTNKPEE